MASQLQFSLPRASKSYQCGFASTVSGVKGEINCPAPGGYVDDGATSGLDKAWHDETHQEQRAM
ncbi:hypothetical protein FOVG_16546 [Fusarium oxysporum f. sp. pisi HDV247]|uniref:Uncharacterized protein n=2 Tax=Fusarium oxysporum TaxID=5507 RepID=X0M8A5_FUSOX|nr:hypothetical protein FOVG_16546 [Fusarium oxysporum f. sp. pisi HDV247]EXM16875.1 hypothetical protein FOTG_14844 [Fusarium oxysporum f. sp. vasinfectum 25433]KAI8414245.1 hypothetical protein FOFC_03855 [Fusarium oxysporum]